MFLTLDELFLRIDNNKDDEIDFNDYLKRDRFYVESLRFEFDQMNENSKFF